MRRRRPRRSRPDRRRRRRGPLWSTGARGSLRPMSARELRARRVSHDAARPDHDGCLARRHTEAVQQRLRFRVLLDIDPAVRQPVACGELTEPSRVRGEARADDLQAGAQPDQELAPQHVGAQDQVPEHRVEQRPLAQPLDRHDEHRARLDDLRREERGLPGQQAQLAEEAARPVHGDEARSGTVAVADRDLAGEHDEEVVAPVALAEQHLARLGPAPLAVARQRFDLPLSEPRERAVAVRRLRRRLRRGRRVHDPIGRP